MTLLEKKGIKTMGNKEEQIVDDAEMTRLLVTGLLKSMGQISSELKEFLDSEEESTAELVRRVLTAMENQEIDRVVRAVVAMKEATVSLNGSDQLKR